MNKKSIKTISMYLLLGMLILLTACSPFVIRSTSEASPATQVPSALYTAGAQTVQAQMPEHATATAPLVSPEATRAEVQQPSTTTEPTKTECQDAAQYITDDGLDGSTYAPNTPFTKTWELKNTGSCTWDDTYLVYYLSGTTMTQQPGYWIVPQGHTVAPGEIIDISIGMTSPPENGSYTSYWGLKPENGQLLPILGGANGNSFYVEVEVNDGSEPAQGSVTDASIGIFLEEGSGTLCTADSSYFVHASITADGPTTASYEIGSSAGQIAAGNFQDMDGNLFPTVSGSVVFDQADTQNIHLRFVGPFPYPDDISVFLQVNGVNGEEFYNAKLSCQG